MAHMNQNRKAKIVARVKPILNKYGIKATLSVQNHSTILLRIKSGPISFGDYATVNPYRYQKQFNGKALEFLNEVMPALNLKGDVDANFDKSDAQSDYFDTGWYVAVTVGRFDKPYEFISDQPSKVIPTAPRESTAHNPSNAPGAFSLPKFCSAFCISRSTAYIEINAGRLRIFKIGKRTLISHDSAREWQRLFEPTV